MSEYVVVVNLKTGEVKSSGKLVLSDEQKKTAVEFLAHICEVVEKSKARKKEIKNQ